MGDIITGGLSAVLSWLPPSPFSLLDSLDPTGQVSEILGMVNWFVPIYSFVGLLEGWLLCIGIYYVYQIALRWLNAIE